VLVICSLSLFMVSLDGTIVNVALPSIQRSLHADVSGLQWVVDSYILVLASLVILSGSTGDRIGRRRLFQIGLFTFSAGSLLCSLAPNLGSLIVFRMLQAVGGSMLSPTSLSIVSNTFTDAKERAVAIGIWGATFGISAACGPILGGLLVQSIGWRSIFWVNVPIGAAAILLARRYLPESRAEHPRRVDLPGQILVIAFLSSLTYAIIEAPRHGWTSPEILTLFAFSFVALAAFLAVERRVVSPLIDLRFFRSPPFAGAAGIASLTFLAWSGFLFLNTLNLQEARGDSALTAGVLTLPATVIVVLVSPLAGRLVARSGPRIPLAVAGVCLAAGASVLSRMTEATPYAVLAVAYVFVGLCFGFINPPITNTALAGMPRSQAGTASAITAGSRQFGSVLGVAIVGSLVSERFRQTLGPKLAALHVTGQRAQALLNGGDQLTARGRVGEVARSTFTLATHVGWDVTIGCGVGIVVLAFLITGPRSQATAAAVGAAMGNDVIDGDVTSGDVMSGDAAPPEAPPVPRRPAR
jgi:EmrB/QacA subfamily drug resistance transporter